MNRIERSSLLARGLLAAWILSAVAVTAQDGTAELTDLPVGDADLVLSGQSVATISFTRTLDGPRFALVSIAAALGIDLRTGPKAESHTLDFGEERILVGPDKSLMVILPAEGEEQEKILPLSEQPIKDFYGLKVGLDFLERSFGERLSYQFTWNPQALELTISRRELRELTGSITLVHLHRYSTVQVEFSQRPRFRVERLPGAFEIRLIGDRMRLLRESSQQDDPLVSAIVTEPDRIRIELADNAAVPQEPRVLPPATLVVDVVEGIAKAPSTPAVRAPFRRPRSPAASPSGVRIIVLDPGHGGKETGAVGPSGTTEAELALQVARSLKQRLERRLPLKKVIMTREGDVDLPLDSRTAIANQNKADLFISLHFNSSFGAGAHGAETYFLSREASDQLAGEVATAENRSGGAAEDPEFGLQLILWDLAQSHHLAASQRFANLVQAELNQALGMRDRGVKQAPFRVLMGATMPAVLVELGFLSNREEEAKLQNPTYIAELVDALFRAVSRFKNQKEAREATLNGSTTGSRATGSPESTTPGSSQTRTP